MTYVTHMRHVFSIAFIVSICLSLIFWNIESRYQSYAVRRWTFLFGLLSSVAALSSLAILILSEYGLFVWN